ncbi:MAG: peptidylprolyl isomerase [Gemmatimonadetes bacterium]|nr:peptidylprolyl isomerase [Gemmatimonadota bacterium]
MDTAEKWLLSARPPTGETLGPNRWRASGVPDHFLRMQRRTLPSTLVLVMPLWLSACGQAETPALTVGAISYTEDQLLGLTQDRRRTLGYLTAFALAVSDSSTLEFGSPLTSTWTADRLLEILAADLTLEVHDVDEDVLEAQYMTNPQWQLTVRHILFFSERWRSDDHRKEAADKAARAMVALRAGADFAETAAELSEEPGAEGRQGLLTPGRDGSWVREFWAAALALEAGEISPVTETQYGYHILRLEQREIVPFEEARSVVARSVADRVADPAAILETWLASTGGAADEQRQAGLAEADRRGLVVPAGERAELERRWEDQVYLWAATFGFRYGASPAQSAEAAMAALSNPAQGVSLARTELVDHSDQFASPYPIQHGAGR